MNNIIYISPGHCHLSMSKMPSVKSITVSIMQCNLLEEQANNLWQLTSLKLLNLEKTVSCHHIF